MFDPSKYVQPPTSPVDWARLRQSSQDSFNNQLAQQQSQRQQQRQFDVTEPRLQGQADEAARSNRVAEAHAQAVLAHQMGVEDRRRKEETYKTVSGLYRKAVVTGDTKGLNLELGVLKQSGLADTTDAMHRHLAERGVALVPGPAPQRQGGADYQSALNSLPGALAELPDTSGQPYSEEVGQRVLGTTAPAGRPAQGVPAITDEPEAAMSDDEVLELLNRKMPDLQAETQGRDEARRKSRFEQGQAQLEGLKLPQVVRDQAVNQLADVTGQQRPYQTVLPAAAPAPKPTEPGAPVDAAAAMPQDVALPTEALEIITSAGDDAPSFGSQALAEGGRYHVVDTDSGQVISEGSLLEAHEEHAANVRKAGAQLTAAITDPYVKKLFEADFDAIAQGLDPGESRQRVEMLLRDRQAAEGRASAERRAYTMAGQRDQAADRQEQGDKTKLLDKVQQRITDLKTENASRLTSVKKLTEQRANLARAVTKIDSGNPAAERQAIRELATAIEPRLTEPDAQWYLENGVSGAFIRGLNKLKGEGELDEGTLANARDSIRMMLSLSDTAYADIASNIRDSIGSDLTLSTYLDEEQLHAAQEIAIKQVLGVNYEQGKYNKAAFKRIIEGGGPAPSKSGKPRALTAEEQEAVDDGLEPL